VPPLFSYFLAKPKKSVLSDKTKLEYYQKVEDLREEKASKRHGAYSNGQYFMMIVHFLWMRFIKGGMNLIKVLLLLKKLLTR